MKIEKFDKLKIACLIRGVSNVEKQQFELVVETIKKLFHDNQTIDFFIHLWSENAFDIEKYQHIAVDGGIIVEANCTYKEEIESIHKHHLSGNGSYAQISCALSLSKVYKLFEKSTSLTEKNYDLIFITRPDCLFTQKLKTIEMTDDLILFNKHGNSPSAFGAGDYCFITNQENLKHFGEIWENLKANPNLIPISMHTWLYPYFTRILQKKVDLSSIAVHSLDLLETENCQIFKHLGGSQAPPNFLQKVELFLREK